MIWDNRQYRGTMKKKYFKILITGSDSFNNKKKLIDLLYKLIADYEAEEKRLGRRK